MSSSDPTPAPQQPERPAAVDPDTPDGSEPSPDDSWGRLRRVGAPRLTRAQILGAVLALLLGFAIATQVQQTQDSGLENMRQDDLVRVLDDVSQRSARLDQQARELQSQRDAFANGAGTSQAAIDRAQKQLDSLRILAGTAPAEGPGVRITIADPNQKVTAAMLLDTLQELRDAGAEVAQYGAVRVVASSWFGSSQGKLTVDGQPISRPVTILAIGDTATLASAMNIPGGIVETIRQQGASATVDQLDTVRIEALQSPLTPRYAQPVPDANTPSPTK